MGFIRGGLLVTACVIFFITLLAGNLFLTMNLSLEYKTVKPQISSMTEKIVSEKINISQKITDEQYQLMILYCQNNTEFNFSESGFDFSVPCETALEGPDKMITESINSLVDEAYYREYECNFWNCFTEMQSPMFLISEKAKDYWANKFYLTLLILAILFVAIFFLAESKANAFILAGALMIVSSLPFTKLNWFFSLFDSYYLQFFNIFFSQSQTIFWIISGFGLIFLAIGIIMKFFKVGFGISDFIQKFQNKSEATSQKVLPKQIIKKK